MATHDMYSAAFTIRQPNSPPMTPGSRHQIRSAPQTRQSSPLSKRMAFSHFAHTPPLEYIEPLGQGHKFRFTRPQSLDLSSRPSSISGRAYATTLHESEAEYDSGDESEVEVIEPRPVRRTLHAQFILEELDEDPGYDCDIEVLQPSQYEDARSEKSVSRVDKQEVYDRMRELHLEQDSSDEDEELRRYRQKKKRWSKGVFKRSHSQSVEGDSSYSDNDPLDDNDPTSRRLRRRLRGPCDRRGSLIFQDPGYANTNNIIEEEPDERGVMHTRGPPSIPSDDAFTLDELPFWKGGESMALDFDSDTRIHIPGVSERF